MALAAGIAGVLLVAGSGHGQSPRQAGQPAASPASPAIATSSLGRATIRRTATRLGFMLSERDIAWGSQVYLRVVKSERKLDVFMRKGSQWVLFRHYRLCGETDLAPGPRTVRAPARLAEGLYALTPDSFARRDGQYLGLSFGWPQRLDTGRGWSRAAGTPLLDGRCSGNGSIGLTDQDMEEVYTLVWAAMNGGQRSVPLHVFPQPLGLLSRLPGTPDPASERLWRDLRAVWQAGAGDGRPPRVRALPTGYEVIE